MFLHGTFLHTKNLFQKAVTAIFCFNFLHVGAGCCRFESCVLHSKIGAMVDAKDLKSFLLYGVLIIPINPLSYSQRGMNNMLWRETVKEPTQLEVARQELFAATRHRDRMLTNFNNALPEFFEIANQELTIAQMTVDVCMKKVKLLTA